MRGAQAFGCYIAKSLVFGEVNGFAAAPGLLIRSIAFVHWTFHCSTDPGV